MYEKKKIQNGTGFFCSRTGLVRRFLCVCKYPPPGGIGGEPTVLGEVVEPNTTPSVGEVEPSDSIDDDDVTIKISDDLNSPSVLWRCYADTITGTTRNVKVNLMRSVPEFFSSFDFETFHRCATANIVLSGDGKATIYIGSKGSFFLDPDQSTCYLYYNNDTKGQVVYDGEATIVRIDDSIDDETFGSINGDDVTIQIFDATFPAPYVSWTGENGYITGTTRNVEIDMRFATLATNYVDINVHNKLSNARCATANIVLSDDGKATIYIVGGLLFPDPDQSTCYLYYCNITRERVIYDGEATIVRMPDEKGDHSTHNNWGPWTSDGNGTTHSRQCLEPGCTEKETGNHDFRGNICSACHYGTLGAGDYVPGDINTTGTPGVITPLPDDKKPIIGVGDKEPDLETDISSGTLDKDIQALPDSSLIGIRYSINVSVTLQKNIFSIIQGTNKRIVLSNGQLQWSFFGQDILYPKSIDLRVDISLLVNTTSPNRRPISNLVGNTPTSVLSFANNGQLPGKATITVSKETLFPNSNYTSFWVYHYDSTRNRLESIARNLRPTSDGYLNFDIWHNSDYIITGEELTNLGSVSTYRGPFGGSGSTPSSIKENPHTGA